jgi:8-oxo-dGTP pyrophosphatase MutT (NUDIX family)
LTPSTAREFSAGGVVLRKMRGRWYVAVIEPYVKRPKKTATAAKSKTPRGPASAEVLALPKGAIDEGETPEQTALREVKEETGVSVDLLTKLTDVRYYYVRNWGDGARVFKIVSFYLLLYRSGRLGNISPDMRIEVQNAFWLPLEEAPKKLSYRGEREVAAKALAYVMANPKLGDYATNTAH